MDRQLADQDFLAGEYSIADMASYPWVNIHDRLQQELDDYPNLKRWHQRIKMRPATLSTYEIGAAINTVPTVTEASRKILPGQNAASPAAW